MARGVRFRVPHVTSDLKEEAALTLLIEELQKIAATVPPLRPNVQRVIEDLDGHLTDLDGTDLIYDPTPEARAILLRAADHLRNQGRNEQIITLRDRLIGTGGLSPIPYRLVSGEGRDLGSFTSYSLGYEVGDRLVTGGGVEYRVVGRIQTSPEGLVVDGWRI